jgi:hypothetical protein
LNRAKGHWEALIVELCSPNYAKVGAKVTDLEGTKVDVTNDAIGKVPGSKYFGVMKSVPFLKELFDNPP